MSKYDQVKKELERIYERDGFLKPSLIVEEARAENSPLHPYFEWDDSKAGENYRRDQARKLIKEIKVEIAPQVMVHRYIHVENDCCKNKEGKYMTWEVVVNTPSYLTIARKEAADILKSAQEAVDELFVTAQKLNDESFRRNSVKIGAWVSSFLSVINDFKKLNWGNQE